MRPDGRGSAVDVPPPMPMSSQRARFEIPHEVASLNCAYMSPLLRAVREAGQAGVAREAAEEFAQSAPFVRHGVVRDWSIREWNEAISEP